MFLNVQFLKDNRWLIAFPSTVITTYWTVQANLKKDKIN